MFLTPFSSHERDVGGMRPDIAGNAALISTAIRLGEAGPFSHGRRHHLFASERCAGYFARREPAAKELRHYQEEHFTHGDSDGSLVDI